MRQPQINSISNTLIHPFQPIYDIYSRVLILGSFPSVISRKEQFYYANTRNRFWQILYALFGQTNDNIPTIDTNILKTQFLLQTHIALWDIAHTCTICNSSDATLQHATPNDISLILSQAHIHAIFCNGQKTYKLFTHFFGKGIESCGYLPYPIQVFALPSSSSANARYSLTELIQAWSIIQHYNTP